MDESCSLKDWTLVQSFLAVAETGSLSGAATRLKRSQPTLGRQIRALETDLQAVLFDRHARGLRLSEAGAALLPHARAMAEAGQALGLAAAGQSADSGGTIRLTASVFLSHYVLPGVLAGLRRDAPDLRIELLASDASDNLLYREADIAIRMYRPTQLDLVIRHLADIPLGVFAAQSYLDRAGRPVRPEDLLDHDLVGFDRNEVILRTMRRLGWPAERDSFAVRCDNQAVYLALIRAGCGIGFTQIGVGRDQPGLEHLDLGLDLPPLPVWLTAHERLRHVPRIARAWDLLAARLPAAL
ncbi:MAG: LysR substrate-binding domain-containing protein [Marinibacterium sp.]